MIYMRNEQNRLQIYKYVGRNIFSILFLNMKLLFAETSSLFLEFLSEVLKNENEICMPTKYSIIRMYCAHYYKHVHIR